MTEKIAFVFPGQGSQSVGMLADLAQAYPEIQLCYEQASDALHYDLWNLVQSGPAQELDQTTHTQPALLVGSYAIYQILMTKLACKPRWFAGHSLGEYTALLCAGSFSFEDAVRLVAKRGELMQNAVAPGVGAMAAIVGLTDNAIDSLCQEVTAGTQYVLTPANYNSLGQVVIAGHTQAVEEAIKIAKNQGAKLAILIPVSVPSHCQLMTEAANQLAQVLETIHIRTPNIPIINNVDVKPYNNADMIRDGLKRQLYSPVRWVETIQYLAAEGVTRIVECGPGKVLTGLNKRINKQLQLQTTNDLISLNAVLES